MAVTEILFRTANLTRVCVVQNLAIILLSKLTNCRLITPSVYFKDFYKTCKKRLKMVLESCQGRFEYCTNYYPPIHDIVQGNKVKDRRANYIKLTSLHFRS